MYSPSNSYRNLDTSIRNANPKVFNTIKYNTPPDARAIFLLDDLCNGTCSVTEGSIKYWGAPTEKIRCVVYVCLRICMLHVCMLVCCVCDVCLCMLSSVYVACVCMYCLYACCLCINCVYVCASTHVHAWCMCIKKS